MDEKSVNHVVAQVAHGGRQRDRGNDKENVSTVEVRMQEETVQRMGKNVENVEEITTSTSRGNRIHMLEEESDSDTEGESFLDGFLAYGIENKDSDSRKKD